MQMKTYSLAILSLITAGTLLFTGCTEAPTPGNLSSADDFVYRGHNFGPDRDAEYIQGVKDGCKTSDGDYTKDHKLFNAENGYRVGWEHGRLHCTGNETSDESRGENQ